MKKNKMMRLASILLIAVLMSTCVISGTFAKYTSSINGTDSARVAKWGWGETNFEIDLFDATYDGNGDNSVANGTSDGKNLIAPGTSKTYTLEFDADESFKPEVAYNVKYTVDIAITDALEEQLTFSLKVDNGAVQNDLTLAQVKTLIEAETADYAPNTDASKTFEIGWTWSFDEGDADNDLDDPANTISVTITILASQLDTYTP